jgi:hypothetical protein
MYYTFLSLQKQTLCSADCRIGPESPPGLRDNLAGLAGNVIRLPGMQTGSVDELRRQRLTGPDKTANILALF